MAQIRQTIELLCKVLSDSGTSLLKAETFRLAKFSHDDAVVPFWSVLFEVLYFCKYGALDDVPRKALAELSKTEIVVYVKREMQRYGFVSKDFATLQNDMSSGSRELLLALGWLMCKENVIDKFMKNRGLEIGEDTFLLHQSEFVQGQGDGDKPSNTMQPPKGCDPPGKIKYLLWLNGKLRMKMRELLALQVEKNKLFHKVHEATEGISSTPDRDHLSMLEVYLLRHPEALKKMMGLLEDDNDRLSRLLQWKEQEDVFWQWMESVLDSKLNDHALPQDEEVSSGIESDGDLPPYSIPIESVHSLATEHNRLQGVILKYEGIVENLETLVELKSSEITPQELDSLIESIDLEISIQKSNISKMNLNHHMQQNQAPVMSYVKKSQNKPTANLGYASQSFQNNNTQGNRLSQPSKALSPGRPNLAENLRDIGEEVYGLQEMIDKLQFEIDNKQTEFRSDMQHISERFNDVICIPPMGKKNI
ncbi:tubulin epsilon and delta complex protein 1-like [Lineus longissimus]|uniref:tubulin epsilon and delta complex protein 1-like n=1 Tax=Lineus longissimus TaxID=88925 RepID=UPI002B4D5FC2